MINHVWSVLCEQVLVNPNTRDISYINTLNNIPIHDISKDSKELKITPFTISSTWHKTGDKDEKLSIQITIKSESEGEITVAEHEAELPATGSFATLSIDVADMNVNDEGLFYIMIEYKYGAQRKYRPAASIPFYISIAKKHTDKES
ncbi:MAG: hypothetical protein GY702_22815 [Desulfobulbaceae bacterium]|nr:hypothetical protein [Desulfobulbaceae bacterium]